MNREEEKIAIIPGTLGFKASDQGRIYGPDNEVRTQYTNGDGYKTACVKLLDGRWQTFGVHRLVALAHIPTDKDITQLTVNHIDHTLTNNDADNLEWVSVYLNNVHASLMRRHVECPTLIMTDSEGRKSFIDNLHDASALLSIDIDLAWAMVRDKLVVNGISLEAFLSNTVIPNELHRPTIGKRDHLGRAIEVPVTIKDLETGQIQNYATMADAALAYSVSPSHIFQCLTTPVKTRLFQRRYLIVRNLEAFPDITPEQYEEMKNPGGKDTLLFDKRNGTTIVFGSAALMIAATGLSKKAVTTRLRRDGIGELGDFIFAYMKNAKQFKDRTNEFQFARL